MGLTRAAASQLVLESQSRSITSQCESACGLQCSRLRARCSVNVEPLSGMNIWQNPNARSNSQTVESVLIMGNHEAVLLRHLADR